MTIIENKFRKNTLVNVSNQLSPPGDQPELSRALDTVGSKLESHFPGRFTALEACLSVKAQLKIEGITEVFPLFLIGPPSSYKSTILEIMSALPDCYVSDSFTPKAFVSHSSNVKKKELEKVDLLPKIRHKTLITPELAPLFSGNPDLLIEYIGILTRILDGRGFQSDSGTHGQRGYRGDYHFTWLGAVVDIPRRVWRVIGNLGPKIYFLRLPPDTKTASEKHQSIKQTLKDNTYAKKLEDSKCVLKIYWELLEDAFGKDKVTWNASADDEQTFDKIVYLAQVLAKLRATIPTWSTRDSDSGGSNYNYETPIIEDPQRAASALYNLARGHALLNGRNHITKDDLGVTIMVTLSSASKERVELFRLLIENDGRLSTEEFEHKASVSKATALKEMEQLSILGLADKLEESGTTKPVMVVKLRSEHDWFLSPEFKAHWSYFRHTSNF